MKPNAYTDFLTDPDQVTRRAELQAFFGPNAARFLPVYDGLHQDAVAGTGRPRFRLGGGGFSVPAFLFGPVWFLYRKMWAIAAIVVIGMIAIGLIPGAGNAGLPIGILLGLLARRVYVQQAIATLQKMRRPDGTIDPAEIRRAGGGSKVAGWISGLIYGAPVIAALAPMILLIQAGEPIPR